MALIKFKYALRDLEAQVDRSDPRVLTVVAKDKDKYVDLSLNLEDIHKTAELKRNLEENRKSYRNTEYLLLDTYFDDLIGKWKF